MKEKHIEEMAFNLIMATSPLGVKDLTKQFDYNTVAKDLYELYGWRKQSDGEWNFHKDGSGTCNRCGTTQKNVWDMDNYQLYCGHCGARMRGALKMLDE